MLTSCSAILSKSLSVRCALCSSRAVGRSGEVTCSTSTPGTCRCHSVGAGQHGRYGCRTAHHACVRRAAQGAGMQDNAKCACLYASLQESSSGERCICTNGRVQEACCPAHCSRLMPPDSSYSQTVKHGLCQLCMPVCLTPCAAAGKGGLSIYEQLACVQPDLLIRRAKKLCRGLLLAVQQQVQTWQHACAHAAAGPACRPDTYTNRCSAHMSAQTGLTE